MKKTLGGDRLGSGKRMQVELHGYERSTHDMGYLFRTTMSAGTLVPFMKEVALPGDTFDIDLNCVVNTHPTLGPLFGKFKIQLDVFQAPIRLYNGQLHNNKLGIGLKMNTVKFPLVELNAPTTQGLTAEEWAAIDIDNMQINPSSIFSYLGIRGIGTNVKVATDRNRYFNAIPWLAYWDITKNYYSNKQEEIGAVIHTGIDLADHQVNQLEVGGTILGYQGIATTVALTNGIEIVLTNAGTYQDPANVLIMVQGTGQNGFVPLNQLATEISVVGAVQTYQFSGLGWWAFAVAQYWLYTDEVSVPTIDVHTFPLENLDNIREAILDATTTPTPFTLTSASPEPFNLPQFINLQGVRSILGSQEGLALKTYNSDLLNNWLSTEWIDGAQGISELTAVDTSGGSFTMDTLALSKKVYDMLNRIAVSGGTYDDWLDAVYTHDRYTRAESPIYHGSLIKELQFQEVVSNAAADGSSSAQPLGTLGGKGVMGDKHKGGQMTIRVDEPSYIIGIASLTPLIDYSQGNDWDTHLETMDDLHKPALDEIGFQELITEQMAWWDTSWETTGGGKWVTKSAGKQPAWINYMTNINKVRGNFAVRDNEMFMTLNRSYQAEVTPGDKIELQDLTTYIDPRIYNQIFADTALDSQNFWMQIGVDMKVRRKISAKIMPNL